MLLMFAAQRNPRLRVPTVPGHPRPCPGIPGRKGPGDRPGQQTRQGRVAAKRRCHRAKEPDEPSEQVLRLDIF